MKISQSVYERLKETEKKEGIFITITSLENGQLSHYQYHKSFPKEDLIPSLEELRKLVIETMV